MNGDDDQQRGCGQRRSAALFVCTVAMALAVLSVRGSAPGHPNCGPGAGDCFQPHPTPGCELEECCDVVCVIDPFCCEKQWDEACVLIAELHCEPGPVCGTGESCFVPHADPGCLQKGCCQFICQMDPYCCSTTWDALCANEAMELCSQRPCDLECTASAGEEEECRADVNGGCASDPPLFTPIECGVAYCGTTWADGIRDTDWYELTVSQSTLIEWSVQSEFPSEISIMLGNCDDGFTVGAMAHGGRCESATATLTVGAGTHYLVVTPGTQYGPIYAGISCADPTQGISYLPMFGPEYVAIVQCTPAPSDCPWDLDPDGTVDMRDVLDLLGAWGPNPAHEADFDDNDAVDVTDLIELLARWGPCSD